MNWEEAEIPMKSQKLRRQGKGMKQKQVQERNRERLGGRMELEKTRDTAYVFKECREETSARGLAC